MECVILVDNSMFTQRARSLSAAKKGVTKLTPEGKTPDDPSWRFDFSKLLAALADGRKIRAAILEVHAHQPMMKSGSWLRRAASP